MGVCFENIPRDAGRRRWPPRRQPCPRPGSFSRVCLHRRCLGQREARRTCPGASSCSQLLTPQVMGEAPPWVLQYALVENPTRLHRELSREGPARFACSATGMSVLTFLARRRLQRGRGSEWTFEKQALLQSSGQTLALEWREKSRCEASSPKTVLQEHLRPVASPGHAHLSVSSTPAQTLCVSMPG